MYCKECGAQNAENVKFCKNCGTPIQQAPQQAQPQQVAPQQIAQPQVIRQPVYPTGRPPKIQPTPKSTQNRLSAARLPNGQEQAGKKFPLKAAIAAILIVAIIGSAAVFAPTLINHAQAMLQNGENVPTGQTAPTVPILQNNITPTQTNEQNTPILQNNTEPIHTIEIDLSVTQLDDETMEDLRQFPNLGLHLGAVSQENFVNNMPLFASLTNLTELTLLSLDSEETDITPLASLTNLTALTLNLRQSQVADITSIANLTNLTYLNLVLGSQTTDITPLASLTNLTSLRLSVDSEITDITALANLTNLTELQLLSGYFQVIDITPLANLTNLMTLTLWGNIRITDLTPLANLTNLTALGLRWSGLISADITPLANLTNLTALTMWANDQMLDITPLANLTNLTTLLLEAQITDITPLASLTNLTELSLHLTFSNDPITDITPLANLTNLTVLRANGIPVTDITPLANLTNLTTLELSSSQITDWSPVAHVPIVVGRPENWAETAEPNETNESVELNELTTQPTAYNNLSPSVNQALQAVIAEYDNIADAEHMNSSIFAGVPNFHFYSIHDIFENGEPALIIRHFFEDGSQGFTPSTAFLYENGHYRNIISDIQAEYFLGNRDLYLQIEFFRDQHGRLILSWYRVLVFSDGVWQARAEQAFIDENFNITRIASALVGWNDGGMYFQAENSITREFRLETSDTLETLNNLTIGTLSNFDILGRYVGGTPGELHIFGMPDLILTPVPHMVGVLD